MILMNSMSRFIRFRSQVLHTLDSPVCCPDFVILLTTTTTGKPHIVV